LADNYTQLQADIVSMLATSDIDAPLFIRLAEKQLNRQLRLQAMLTKTTLSSPTLTGDRYVAALPSDFLEVFHVEQDGVRLEYRTPNGYDADDGYIYTVVGSDLHVTEADDITLWYYGSETALSATNTTNTFTTKCYDGLLYVALGHAAVYMNEPDKAAAFADVGMALVRSAQDRDTMARQSGAPLVQQGG
jgi:hypothetical protein